MTTKIKEPVRIREKKLRNGNVSLYLAININGRREYEFLKLYLRPELSKQDKAINRETLALANAVKAQRILDIQSGRFGMKNEKKILLIDYYTKLAEQRRRKSESNYKAWMAALGQIRQYDRRDDIALRDVSPKWLNDFKAWLQQRYSRGTCNNYLGRIRTALKQAYNEGVTTEDLSRGVSSCGKTESAREYLTLDEIKRLVATECPDDVIKRVFLFSCLTGLRRSDIEKLTWGEVSNADSRTRITFKQKKTGGVEYLDINEQAAELIGERGMAKSDDRVFGSIPAVGTTNYKLRIWASRAGINKHITFHSARHSFAVLMLEIGTEIYTVSKLLGHREIRTTQIYAKIVDKKKQEAVDNIPKIF